MAVLIVVGNACSVIRALGVLHRPDAVPNLSDHHYYIQMAVDASGTSPEAHPTGDPYCRRFLVPWLAGQLIRAGLDTNLSFYVISATFLSLFLLALFALLRARGFSMRYAVLGMLLAGMIPGAVRWYVYQYWMTDPAALFLFTLSCLAIRRRRERVVGPLSAVAVPVRESQLLVFPYLALAVLRRDGLARAVRVTAFALVWPALVVLAMALLIHFPPTVPYTVRVQRLFAMRCSDPAHQIYLATVGSFGALLPLLFLFPRRALAYWRRHYDDLALVLCAYLSVACSVNTERMLAFALPAVLPAALRSLRLFVRASDIPFHVAAGAVLAAQLWFFLRTDLHGLPGPGNPQPIRIDTILAVTLLLVGGGIALYTRRPGAALSPPGA